MIHIHAVELANALGRSREAILAHWREGVAPGLVSSEAWLADGRRVSFGSVEGGLPTLPPGFEVEDSRNNRLLCSVYEQGRAAFDACMAGLDPESIAVVMATSTSGSDEVDRYVSSVVNGEPPAPFHG